jgi:predicted membrane chloride channel (bestrophin family)
MKISRSYGLSEFQMAWLAVPTWSARAPFEDGANDVPISQISRLIEIELREMLGESDLPQPLRPKNAIIL